MQDLQKIISYIGFAARARKIVFGVDSIVKKPRVRVIILSPEAGENTAKQIKAYAEKTSSPIIVLEGATLEEILKKNNCKVVAVIDPSLAKAIIENA